MARATSPALSENEVDISKSLFDASTRGSDIDDDSDNDGDSAGANGRESRSNGGATGALEQPTSEDDDEAFIAATQVAANRRSELKISKKSGAFQAMGLNPRLLKAITRKGFSMPTPIQRKCIPLILEGQDVVGMARTGSGKTAAFVLPMIEKLKSHSAKVGARALVLSPSRELALQTLKVVKEMARGTDLRVCLLVGGDSLEDQFGAVASNPDIIIATPGRFEHLKVEMSLELSSVRFVVFDEADRLFEMGFAAQLAEIMPSLPSNRQTLLFSATLPKSLVEFARAGLQDPKLVRLDVEGKVSPGLESAFFLVKRAEKEGALLHLLQDVIKMPLGSPVTVTTASTEGGKKRKRGSEGSIGSEMPSPHSTVVFAATKHHVEYLAALLIRLGYATSYVYGSLDQTARKIQTQDFRSGKTNILVVTDVAARGLDIPVLANVINYDFPPQPKVFVHRVGRTARAGKPGWAYNLVSEKDMPYLVDLQLFLSRKLVLGRASKDLQNIFKECVVIGSFVTDALERSLEEASKVIEEDVDLSSMRSVAAKGEKQYLRTRNSASAQSVKRAKELFQSDEARGLNMLFDNDDSAGLEQARLDMLARVSGFRPQETVFEIGRRGDKTDSAGEIMRQRRAKIQPRHRIAKSENQNEEVNPEQSSKNLHDAELEADTEDEELELSRPNGADMEEASESELELTFSHRESSGGGLNNKRSVTGQDSDFFMSYAPATINLVEDQGYGVHSGGGGHNSSTSNSFVTAARSAALDLTQDEHRALSAASKPRSGLRWDKRSKKYVQRANDTDGSAAGSKRYITGESGQKLAASFKSGRFDAWKKANRISRLPRVGDQESNGHAAATANTSFARDAAAPGTKRFKHHRQQAPKDADRFRDDYDVRKRRVAAAREAGRGKYADAAPRGRGRVRSEVKSVDDVRKARKVMEKRREKNARPGRRR